MTRFASSLARVVLWVALIAVIAAVKVAIRHG
jgi:hypothetical protein